jgi:L-threonylcarbamoyladenylate synthase
MQDEILKAVEVLKAGGIIVYPTDTIWGIGCDATNEEAVQKIYTLKQRSDAKSMICLVDSDIRLLRVVPDIHELAWELIEFTENPLTLIYDNPNGLAPSVVASDKTVGIRITKDDFCKRVIQKLGKPLVSTSANISGEASPKTFKEIGAAILEGADYVVNLHREKNEASKPSTIIRLKTNGEIKVLRK